MPSGVEPFHELMLRKYELSGEHFCANLDQRRVLPINFAGKAASFCPVAIGVMVFQLVAKRE